MQIEVNTVAHISAIIQKIKKKKNNVPIIIIEIIVIFIMLRYLSIIPY